MTLTSIHKQIEALYEKMELQANEELRERMKAVSLRFPGRIVELIAGHGLAYVNIYTKSVHNALTWSPHSFAGKIRYQLIHCGDVDGPEILKDVRDYLFTEMEKIEDDDNRYRCSSMVEGSCVKYLNGVAQ